MPCEVCLYTPIKSFEVPIGVPSLARWCLYVLLEQFDERYPSSVHRCISPWLLRNLNYGEKAI